MASIFENVAMVATVLRVRDVDASVRWYRDKLGLEPVRVSADGPANPVAVYHLSGSVVTLWQLPVGRSRVLLDNDTNSYVVVVVNGGIKGLRRTLVERGVEVGDIKRSAANEFFWFYDLDDNRFEVSRPLER